MTLGLPQASSASCVTAPSLMSWVNSCTPRADDTVSRTRCAHAFYSSSFSGFCLINFYFSCILVTGTLRILLYDS